MARSKKNGTGRRRGRSAKKAVDKADTVEVKAAGELDLDTVQINKSDFAMYFRGIEEGSKAMKRAKSAYDDACKKAKKSSDAMLAACKLKLKWDGKDQNELAELLKIQGFVLTDLGSPIQLTLHNALLGDAVDTAYKRGQDAGLAGKGNDNRYPVGSDLAERYDMGHLEGQKSLIGKGHPAPGTNSGDALPLN